MRDLVPGALVAASLSVLLAWAAARPVQAAPLHRNVAFELDRWIDLGFKDGPITIHRLRLERKSGLKGIKSVMSRPGHAEYLQDVQVQLEYTNDSTSDWKVKAGIVWLDAAGETIDGYHGSQDLDDGERHQLATASVSTLRYGLNQARRLSIDLEVEPD